MTQLTTENQNHQNLHYIIYGSGAVGSTIGARLWLCGKEVTLIGRGAHGEHLKSQGLRFLTPELDEILPIPALSDVSDIVFSENTVIFLCVKSQQTQLALERLAMVAPSSVPVCCVQNAVANERVALRYFKNVYATLVNLPAMYLKAGEVASYVEGLAGVLDTGKFPGGVDRLNEKIVEDFRDAGFGAVADSKVMRKKYAKLLRNVGNAVQAILEEGPETKPIYKAVREEAELCYEAEKIEYATHEEMTKISDGMRLARVKGYEKTASSSWQSLARGTGDIETDYLNGEISYLGRMNGLPTPYNDLLVRLAREFISDNRRPATMAVEEFFRRLNL